MKVSWSPVEIETVRACLPIRVVLPHAVDVQPDETLAPAITVFHRGTPVPVQGGVQTPFIVHACVDIVPVGALLLIADIAVETASVPPRGCSGPVWYMRPVDIRPTT